MLFIIHVIQSQDLMCALHAHIYDEWVLCRQQTLARNRRSMMRTCIWRGWMSGTLYLFLYLYNKAKAKADSAYQSQLSLKEGTLVNNDQHAESLHLCMPMPILILMGNTLSDRERKADALACCMQRLMRHGAVSETVHGCCFLILVIMPRSLAWPSK